MKTTVFVFLLYFFISVQFMSAGNLVISSTSLTGQNIGAGVNHPNNYKMVKFDVSWCNSWRTATLESNWDAVWLFVKYRKLADVDWQHAVIHENGHVVPGGSTITAAVDGFGIPTGTGVFIHRSAAGIGDVNFANVQLRWDYGQNGLADYDSVEICVFGIEMVYVPTGSFYVGSGGIETGTFTNGSWSGTHMVTSSIPFQITSENAITLGNAAGQLWATGGGGATNHSLGNPVAANIPATYPKGYHGFYSMKYEISQGQYVAFLNKLTRDQQNNRTETNLATTITTTANIFVMTNTATLQYRNSIVCPTAFDANLPITFYNDLNANGTYNEANDGEHISMNYLNWNDLTAYADWSGLRPMTELEFEKACRGSALLPVANEYVWGNTNVYGATGLSNNGADNEYASNTNANVNYNNHAAVQGATRAGMFAKPTSSTREETGATYYGITEMGGNMREQVVNVCTAQGLAFPGSCGNGVLNATGNADETGWPNYTACALRGGSYATGTTELRISDRTYANWRNLNGTTGRYASMGGRLAITAP